MMRYLRLREVLARIGVSWVTLWRWEREGLFPKRRKIGKRAVAWVEAEIDDWCEKRSAGESWGPSSSAAHYKACTTPMSVCHARLLGHHPSSMCCLLSARMLFQANGLTNAIKLTCLLTGLKGGIWIFAVALRQHGKWPGLR